jgi:hypothetical protein
MFEKSISKLNDLKKQLEELKSDNSESIKSYLDQYRKILN